MSTPPAVARFGAFALDIGQFELRRDGRVVKLERQAMDLLILLVERHGQLVSRPEIVSRLWGDSVFVDVDTGVNTAIRKIRQALHDSADAPTMIETVQGKGYRFIAPVAASAPAVLASEASVATPTASVEPPARLRAGPWMPAVALVAVVVALVGALRFQRPAIPATDTQRVTVAVLPFETLNGGEAGREYFATGLTEDTIASLAQIAPERLSVKGRTLRYRGDGRAAIDIGRELAVDYLVESTIRVEGGHVRVIATLLRVSDEQRVWSHSYDRQLASVLGLQQELSADIAREVRIRLAPGQPHQSALRQTRNAEAYDAYLRGRDFEQRRTPDGNRNAVAQYQRAIALDPDYALAWASLAFTIAGSTMNGDVSPRAAGPPARAAAARAIAANADLAEAQLADGYVKWLLDWDWPAADLALTRATRLDPSAANAVRQHGHALSQSGRFAEADTAMLRTRDLEPLEPVSFALSAQVAFQNRDNTSARDFARRALELDASFWIGHVELGQAFAQMGETALALEALKDAARFSGGNSKALSLRGYVLARAGRSDEAREVLRALAHTAATRYVPPYASALVFAGLGDREETFAWLERAYNERDVHLIFLVADPKWDPYRDDPRFVSLVTRCQFVTAARP